MYSARTLLVPVFLMGGLNGSGIGSTQVHFSGSSRLAGAGNRRGVPFFL